MSPVLALSSQDPVRDFESFVAGEASMVKEDLLKKHTILADVTEAKSEPIQIRPLVKPVLVPFFGLLVEGREYIFGTPLAVTIYQHGSLIVAENERLHLLAYGYDREEAVSTFAISFDALYRDLCDSEMSELSNHAIALRALLSNLVHSVS